MNRPGVRCMFNAVLTRLRPTIHSQEAARKFLMCSGCKHRQLQLAHKSSDMTLPQNCVDPSSRQFETKSPYKGEGRQIRQQFKKKRWDGGLLPRPDEMKDVPIKGLPEYDPKKNDQWTAEKALFGQNDYIDILGDGSVHPSDTMEGPIWLRRSKGNEFKRILRQFAFEDEYLREMEPENYHMMEKNARYLHKDGSRRIAKRGERLTARRKSRTDRFNTAKDFLY